MVTPRILVVCLLSLFTFERQFAAESSIPLQFDQFLESHCFECHDDTVQKGELNLLDLDFNLADPYLMKKWVHVFDRIDSGEMPPVKRPRPEDNEKIAALQALRQPLFSADRTRIENEGRVKVRRLTRREYQNTVQDLLGIAVPLKEYLPEDSIVHIFDTEASTQQLSHFHLEQYLDAADIALRYAFSRALKEEQPFELKLNPKLICNKKTGGNYRGPEEKAGRAIFWPYHRLQFYGRMLTAEAPESGWYQISLKGVDAVNSEVVWGILQSGTCFSNAPALFHVGLVEATKTKCDITFQAYLQKGHRLRLRPADSTIPQSKWRPNGGKLNYEGNNIEESGTQGISIEGVHLKRVFPKADRAQAAKHLFGTQTPDQLSKQGKQERQHYINRRIRSFANRAFRRPVSNQQIQPYYDLVAAEFSKTNNLVESLFLGYRAILCSPRFLNFYEQPGKLDQHALANRISYMLWNSTPDWPLRQLADEGKLHGNAITETAERLLNHKRSEHFIRTFTDQWLKLNEIDATAPDRRFKAYDPIVHQSIVKETQLFFNRLVEENLSVKHFIRSDFSILNERLVRYYQIKNTNIKIGNGFQKVDLGYNPRGGLITHTSVLKVTADGTTTSPIVRGVYVNERILGRKIPPPPPGIPAVEPDIRGAISIRDQIEKHRNSENCAACHRKIDPAGFALEIFDPAGLWRKQYGNQKNSAKVDPSGITPDGKSFKNISEWKRIYANQPKLLATALAEHLITYGTGARPNFSDRDAIDQIVAASAADNYGVRSLIINTISSEPFLTK